jgi:glutamate transport system permease protein
VKAPEHTVLYDALGRRGRARVRVGTVLVLTVALVMLALVGNRLADQGQFEWAKWSPLIDPRDPSFAPLWKLLGRGLLYTLQAALLAIAISLLAGTAIAITRFGAAPWYRWAIVTEVELLRGVPVVLAIFFSWKVLPQWGLDLPLLWYVVIGLVVYNHVVIAEILRAGLGALPRGQREAALAIGLTQGQTLRMILLPQAFRIMLPALISQLVVALKDTSLGFIIGYEELLRRANIAIQTTRNPIQMLLFVALIYIVINYSLGLLAEFTQRRLARSRSSSPAPSGPSTRLTGDEAQTGIPDQA